MARLRRALPFLIGVVIFIGALDLLRQELQALTWRQITTAISGTSASRLGLAVLLTALNFAVLTGYDLLAFEYIGKRLPLARVMGTSLLAYAISNSVGLGVLSGASVRYRFYSRWGVTDGELSRIVLSYSVTFWLGLLALGGASLVVIPPPATLGPSSRALIAPVGVLLALSAIAYASVDTQNRPLMDS